MQEKVVTQIRNINSDPYSEINKVKSKIEKKTSDAIQLFVQQLQQDTSRFCYMYIYDIYTCNVLLKGK